MNSSEESRHYVAIIGGGPSGLFAARELAEQGVRSIIFNRDIKPGGLAEYGIYPAKTRLKEGLRNQFRQILALDEVDYYGNVVIGEQGDLSLNDLREIGLQALLVTVGAQGAKRLSIPGEDLTGVYDAKDLVYHYNALPPFSENTYQIGKRVAIIGVGNVMMDIARWLMEEKEVEMVTAIARRGPTDVKFDRKELEAVARCVNRPMLIEELERVGPMVKAVGLDPMELVALVDEVSAKIPDKVCYTNICMRFLSSPSAILGDEQGRVKGLQIEENYLVLSEDGVTRPVSTGKHTVLEVDTVVFAIGDLVDKRVGLPVNRGTFCLCESPRYLQDGSSYEVIDPATGQIVPDIFLAGWARRPSIGLVGIARRDAVNAARVVASYVKTLESSSEPVDQKVCDTLMRLNKPIVDKGMLDRLQQIERQRAAELGVDFFKFASNADMLQVLDMV
jgi:ferredoxin/flavodoxin---NADP+ reductase